MLSRQDGELRKCCELIAALGNENQTLKQKAKRNIDRAKTSAVANK